MERVNLEELVEYTEQYTKDNIHLFTDLDVSPSVTLNTEFSSAFYKERPHFFETTVLNTNLVADIEASLRAFDSLNNAKKWDTLSKWCVSDGHDWISRAGRVQLSSYLMTYSLVIKECASGYYCEVLGRSLAANDGRTIYKSPSMKLGKLLNKLGMKEGAIPKVVAACSQKGKQYSLCLTDMYIPEHYMAMKKHRNLKSCMSYSPRHYELNGMAEDCSDLHPLMAYERSPNLKLGLIKEVGRSDYPYIGRFIYQHNSEARCPRVYGDQGQRILDKAGVAVRTIAGGVLEKVDVGDNFLLPYIDGNTQGVRVEGETLVICAEKNGAKYFGNHETGLAITATCSICDRECEGGEEMEYVDGDAVCPSCLEEEYVYLDDEYVPRDSCEELDYEIYGYGEWAREDDVTYSYYHSGYILDEHLAELEVETKYGSSVIYYHEDYEDEVKEAYGLGEEE